MKDRLTLIIIVVIVAIILVACFIELSISRIFFDFRISGVSIKNLSLSQLVNKGQSLIDVSVDSTIYNRNRFSLKARDLYVEIYYNNQLVAYSSTNASNLLPINIPSNATVTFKEWLNIVINANSIEMFDKFSQNLPFQYTYKIKFKLFWFPVSSSDTITYHEDTVPKTIV